MDLVKKIDRLLGEKMDRLKRTVNYGRKAQPFLSSRFTASCTESAMAFCLFC